MVSPLDASIHPQHSPTTQPVEQVDLSSASKQDFMFHNSLYRDQLFKLDIRSPVSDTCAFPQHVPGNGPEQERHCDDKDVEEWNPLS